MLWPVKVATRLADSSHSTACDANGHASRGSETNVSISATGQTYEVDMQELREMRAAGVRTFEDAEEYEAEKRKHTAESGRSGEWSHRPSLQVGMEDTSTAVQVICLICFQSLCCPLQQLLQQVATGFLENRQGSPFLRGQ